MIRTKSNQLISLHLKKTSEQVQSGLQINPPSYNCATSNSQTFINSNNPILSFNETNLTRSNMDADFLVVTNTSHNHHSTNYDHSSYDHSNYDHSNPINTNAQTIDSTNHLNSMIKSDQPPSYRKLFPIDSKLDK